MTNGLKFRDRVPNRKVTVLGAGLSGAAAARLLKRNGAAVFASEQRAASDMGEAAQVLASAGVKAEFGGHSPRAFDADWMVLSPGIPLSAPVVVEAKKKGIKILGELEVASWFCRAEAVAVTGSNGKSTSTTLIGAMFEASGRPVAVAGNIGKPFSDVADSLGREAVAVLEVSSFQLETVETFLPKAALFLNLTQDHLNRHGSLETYGRIKARLFKNQGEDDWLILNGLDRRVLDLSESAKSRKAYFGIDVADRDCGYVRDGMLVLRLGAREETLLPIGDVGIRGEHNTANALAAALTCRAMGVPVGDIVAVLRTFNGLPHRLESVRELDGVLYVNDSKGTNVDSVWYALGSFDRPIIWIAGGRDKDSDFTVLANRVQDRVRSIVLIGEAADKMEKAFDGIKPVVRAGSLREAVAEARRLALPGDVVLLSPACASFDMFRNFEDRGDQFRILVKALP